MKDQSPRLDAVGEGFFLPYGSLCGPTRCTGFRPLRRKERRLRTSTRCTHWPSV